MRRLVPTLLVLVLLAAPAAALARDQVSGDGSLVVTDAWVRQIVVQGNGVIFGHIDSGTLTVYSYDPADSRPSQVSGAVAKVSGTTTRYSGSDVRFLFPNGHYLLKLEGGGIDISAVGRGTVTATGLGTEDDGSLSINGNKPQKLGFISSLALFGAATPPAAATTTSTAKAATH
jgi:hypothetical protein